MLVTNVQMLRIGSSFPPPFRLLCTFLIAIIKIPPNPCGQAVFENRKK